MNRGPDRGYFPEPAKSLFISDTPGQEAAEKRYFAAEGLNLNFISGSPYLGAYLGPQAELEAWVKPQVEAWDHGVKVLAKIDQRHPQWDYFGLGMLLQLECQYLQRTVPGVGTLMGPIEEALREKPPPSLFGGEEITADFRKILCHSVKHGGLGIPYPWQSAECAYNTSKAASRELVDSLLGGSVLNYVGHRACVRKASQSARLSKQIAEMLELYDTQEQAFRQDKNRLHRATRNGAWLSAVPHMQYANDVAR